MPGISRLGQEDLIALYRDATRRLAKLAGVTRPSFRCQRCRRCQGVSGRRQVVRGTSRYGYYCAQCASEGAL
jgi:hypothetical protein